MPTYDYVCQACEHAFEHWQTMTSPTKRTCPKCKKRKLRRLIGSGAGVIFKGSGFYETDYKRKSRGSGKPDKESSDSGSDAPSESKDVGDTAKKPAEKSSGEDTAKPPKKKKDGD